MALQKTSLAPTILEVVGSFAPIAFGIATADTTTLEVTIPQFSVVYGALVLSSTTTTAGFVATTSGNTFTATVGSAEVCMYIAFGKLRA